MPWASSRSSSRAAAVSSPAASSIRASSLVTIGGRAGTREAQVVGQREQPLLGAVVEVALEPAPLGVAGLDDPRARRAQIMELGQHLGLQPFVLEREPDGGADLALELGDRHGVRDDRDLAAVAHERG